MSNRTDHLVRLCDWERNGYNDSDWYVALFNTETHELTCVEYATTRFPSCHDLSMYPIPTVEQVELARIALQKEILKRLVEQENLAINEPNNVDLGDRVALLVEHKNQAKECTETTCDKCSGTGKWINPRNAQDIRECFACKGQGSRKSNFSKIKGENGKPVWIKFPAGVKGKVVWVGTYRTIYRNGYNKADRGTLTTRVLLDDGREMTVPLSKLRLDKAVRSEEQLNAVAEELSHSLNFGKLFSHCYWESNNWAKAVLLHEKTKKDSENPGI